MIYIILTFFLPLVMSALGIPLALGLIKPNLIYGVRTVKTLSSNQDWYYYNQRAGKAMVVSGMLGFFGGLAIWWGLNLAPGDKLCLSLLVSAILLGTSVLSVVFIKKK